MDMITLSVFANRIEAICDEMGAMLQRAAFSPNIRDRLDFSCAIFDAHGELCAQAAHIPVHLGSMAYAMRDIVSNIDWLPGDMVVMNDPYLGGTHLPDVTLIAPVFVDQQLIAFTANRAHHADIGASAPGSMPLSSTLEEEGMIIPPMRLVRQGVLDEACMQAITESVQNPAEGRGDFAAQISANRCGGERLQALIQSMGSAAFNEALVALNDYAERLARAALQDIPDGTYCFTDAMDDDGLGHNDINIDVCICVQGDQIHVDFSGTHSEVRGNINCPLSVAAAGVYYVFRCLMPPQTPACAGSFRSISLDAPEACLLNARRPAAVAAGNVETSTRVVDAVMGALAKAIPDRIPAASHGSMNNIAMGARDATVNWDYYETLGGGMGASKITDGLNAVQTHMTNTLNTPIETLEMRFPLRITQYAVRDDSGGDGLHSGGDGLIREFTFLQPATVTLLTERRRIAPWGLAGGLPGKHGRNFHNDHPVPAKTSLQLKAGDRVRIETPGAGGWGKPAD